MASRTPSKVPHSLRMAILLLRIALGLNFFYFGFAVLFNPELSRAFRAESFNNLYSWLATPVSTGWVHPFAQWAFLIVGACLILGLAVRLASAVGIAVLLLSFLPNLSYAALSVEQFVNDEVIAILCLLILFLANAGTYVGLDNSHPIPSRGNPRQTAARAVPAHPRAYRAHGPDVLTP